MVRFFWATIDDVMASLNCWIRSSDAAGSSTMSLWAVFRVDKRLTLNPTMIASIARTMANVVISFTLIVARMSLLPVHFYVPHTAKTMQISKMPASISNGT